MSVYAEHRGYTRDAQELRLKAAAEKDPRKKKKLLELAAKAQAWADEAWRDAIHEARADAYYERHQYDRDDDYEEDDDE